MVRRGSTVRVRQRALRSRKSEAVRSAWEVGCFASVLSESMNSNVYSGSSPARAPPRTSSRASQIRHISRNGRRVSSGVDDDHSPVRVGKRAVVTRRAGPRTMASTAEVAEVVPPHRWVIRGVDGAVRGNVSGRIETLQDGARSCVTIEFELYGHGIGKLLLHFVVKRQAEREMPENARRLKERLEAAGEVATNTARASTSAQRVHFAADGVAVAE